MWDSLVAVNVIRCSSITSITLGMLSPLLDKLNVKLKSFLHVN